VTRTATGTGVTVTVAAAAAAGNCGAGHGPGPPAVTVDSVSDGRPGSRSDCQGTVTVVTVAFRCYSSVLLSDYVTLAAAPGPACEMMQRPGASSHWQVTSQLSCY
jgi:hypothetical protein